MDSLSKARRSWNMSRIRATNTNPELIVRSLLHRLGFRFRLHERTLPGRPDLTLKKYRSIVLVHGCFWHRHAGCPFAYTPKSNTIFWNKKFKANVERDRRNIHELRRLGWKVIIVWECQTRYGERLSRRLESRLRSNERQLAEAQ
ncbi:T/G mismatch-specific endonuclease [Candidatus Koribacter versatilis Ellin345]|uniref:Very short patch repair endonuclease n=1 Tax=Koribacter versatilis (strain Ellin345) TaxID=204669 RepID=Q1IIN5_KORVE|nr:DNA mismatch endonuclease Vsr [Candidatus Koribacter versatilis]ABF43265.1 T/G mismatch-specific endonuclease [Candidatus Koribacter versatilis Ellin345]